jgi:dolichol-phosphate mannosyltransferase
VRTIVVIPTYNERENIAALLPELLRLDPSIEVLVVDDDSPDGTADAVRSVATEEKRVHLVVRPVKAGLGPAYREGFAKALELGADLIIQMDADFSHKPEAVPRLIEEIDHCDVVIGSRYLSGVNVVNWPLSRLLLSYFANVYARWITGLPLRDSTGGFKCWRRKVLEAIDLSSVQSDGYAFQIETSFLAHRKGFRIKEIPIVFEDRHSGTSKMTKAIVREAFWMVLKLRLKHPLARR